MSITGMYIISCMPFDRFPRRMLSSWLPSPRCRGAANMTYGRTMTKVKAQLLTLTPQIQIGPSLRAADDREKWRMQ